MKNTQMHVYTIVYADKMHSTMDSFHKGTHATRNLGT